MKKFYLLLMAAVAVSASAQDAENWNFHPSRVDNYFLYSAGEEPHYSNTVWFSYDSEGRLIQRIQGQDTDLQNVVTVGPSSRALDEEGYPDKYVYTYDSVVKNWRTSCKVYELIPGGTWQEQVYNDDNYTLEVTRDAQGRISRILKPEEDGDYEKLTIDYGTDGKAERLTHVEIDSQGMINDSTVCSKLVWLETDGQITAMGDFAALCLRGSTNRPLSCHVENWDEGELCEEYDVKVTYTDARGSFRYELTGRELLYQETPAPYSRAGTVWEEIKNTVTYTYTDDYGSFKRVTEITEGDWTETEEFTKTLDRFGIVTYIDENYDYSYEIKGTVTYDPQTGLPAAVDYDLGYNGAIRMVFSGGYEAGIREIAADSSEQLYDLLGRKTSGRRPGLYISRSGKHLRR